MNIFFKCFLSLCFCLLFSKTKAQLVSADALLESNFSEYQSKETKPRSVMTFKDRSFLSIINPFSYASIGLMFTYQRLVSQQIGADCPYELSCSEHAKRAVERYGILKGAMIGFYQLQSCSPRTGYDFPDHAINSDGRIINPIEIDED